MIVITAVTITSSNLSKHQLLFKNSSIERANELAIGKVQANYYKKIVFLASHLALKQSYAMYTSMNYFIKLM